MATPEVAAETLVVASTAAAVAAALTVAEAAAQVESPATATAAARDSKTFPDLAVVIVAASVRVKLQLEHRRPEHFEAVGLIAQSRIAQRRAEVVARRRQAL